MTRQTTTHSDAATANESCKSVGQQASPNPYVFIVGSPRSGTTLLKRMIDAHPKIAVTPETHWIPRYYRETGLTSAGVITPKLLPKLFEHPRFKRLELAPSTIECLVDTDAPISYAKLVSSIFDLYGQRAGKSLVGDKTPPYVRKIGLLHKLWPKARFVHIIRDGREVCLSMLDWSKAHRAAGRCSTWNEDPVSTTALWWEWQVRLGMETGRDLSPNLYYEMRYEELINDPEDQCRTLCDFLGLPYHEAMLHYHAGKTKTDPGISAKRAWLPPTPGLRNWHTQMSVEDLERFEAAAGPLLDELSYDRGIANPSPQAAAHAQQLRRLFDGGPLPRRLKAHGE